MHKLLRGYRKGSETFRSRERKFSGNFAPGNENSRELQKKMLTDYPGSESSRELSLPGTKVISGNFRSEERKHRGAKSPVTTVSARMCPVCPAHIDIFTAVLINCIGANKMITEMFHTYW